MEEILHDVNNCFCPSPEQTRNLFGGDSIVSGRLNGEPQTPRMSCISNAAIPSLKILLSAGQNLSTEKWLRDLFFNEDSNISTMIFYSQPWAEHTRWMKKELSCKRISLSTRQTFFL